MVQEKDVSRNFQGYKADTIWSEQNNVIHAEKTDVAGQRVVFWMSVS